MFKEFLRHLRRIFSHRKTDHSPKGIDSSVEKADYSSLPPMHIGMAGHWLNETTFTVALIRAADKMFNIKVKKGDFKVQRECDATFTTDLADIISAKIGIGGFEVEEKLMAAILAGRSQNVLKVSPIFPKPGTKHNKRKKDKPRRRSPKKESTK